MDNPHFDFPVIDAHVHLYPDQLAPKVVPMLASRFISTKCESYTSKSPVERKMPAKEITTLGFLLEPRFDEHWGMEFEGAKQFGRTLNGNRQAGGWMVHGDYYDSSKPAYFIRWEVSFKF